MKKKYNSIIAITFVIIFIIALLFILFYSTCFGCNPKVTSLESTITNYCVFLTRNDCKDSSNSIIIDDFDANKDGKIDSADTLLELCKNYYDIDTDLECKIMCGCPEIEPSENTSTIPLPKTYDVAIRNFVYSLTITNIKVGDSVKWTNFDVNAHTATADDGSFDTGLLSKGESKTIVFDTAGTYVYHCSTHSWMMGKIVVK